jgi:hypothetical protein
MLAKLAQLTTLSTETEMDVKDQDQRAIASRDIQLMDSAALTAKPAMLSTQTTTDNVIQLQPALETTNTEELVMQLPAMHAKHANQTSRSTNKEPDASDQSQSATVSKNIEMITMLALTVVLEKLLTQITTNNVSLPMLVTVLTNTEVLLMPEPAIHARPAQPVTESTQPEMDVTLSQ